MKQKEIFIYGESIVMGCDGKFSSAWGAESIACIDVVEYGKLIEHICEASEQPDTFAENDLFEREPTCRESYAPEDVYNDYIPGEEYEVLAMLEYDYTEELFAEE